MFVIGETAVFHITHVVGNRTCYFLADMRVSLDELRSEVIHDAEQIIDHEDLSVTVGPGTDSNRRDVDGGSDFPGQRARNTFENDGKTTQLFE